MQRGSVTGNIGGGVWKESVQRGGWRQSIEEEWGGERKNQNNQLTLNHGQSESF